MKKKSVYNLLMAAAVVLIVIAGLMMVGSVKGWQFPGGGDKEEKTAVSAPGEDGEDPAGGRGTEQGNVSGETAADTEADTEESAGNANFDIADTEKGEDVLPALVTAKEKTGGVNIERMGIAYRLEDGTKLRDGDILQTLNGATVTVDMDGDTVCLGQNCEVKLHLDEEKGVSFDLKTGEVFADISSTPVALQLGDSQARTEEAVFSADVRVGSANVFVYAGTVQTDEHTVESGEAAGILSDGTTVRDLSLQSLDEFLLERTASLADGAALCFTKEQISGVQEERRAAMAQVIADRQEEQRQARVEQQREANLQNSLADEAVENAGGGSSGTGGSSSGSGTGGSAGNFGGSSDGGSGNSGSGSGYSEAPGVVDIGGDSGSVPEAPAANTCTIEIRCDTILNNMGDLREGKSAYVPLNGVILAASTLEFTEGDTVFDVLQNACSLAGIQLEYSYTPAYDSYYIEGINNLYEFDCGNESGWIYKVNGWSPNYGCSSYYVENGDVISWCYTCQGLGADVGGSVG